MRPRRTRNGIEVQMTADELLSLAVNVANGWSLEDLGLDQTANPTALNKMLAEVYRALLDFQRKMLEQRTADVSPTNRSPDV